VITIVMGGQYGSEGKGSVVSYLAKNYQFDLVIRTGGVNAGHTFKGKKDELFKMRQLPCTWFSQPEVPIYLPPSAIIDELVLESEILLVNKNGYKGQVFVSPQAAVVTSFAEKIQRTLQDTERGGRPARTGKNVGSTRAAKCIRRAMIYGDSRKPDIKMEQILQDFSKQILIESTQGFGLSLDYRTYPFCTSSNLTPFAILNEAGIPWGVHQVKVLMVFRTFPIRIAGNSGFLFNETSWEQLRVRFGDHIPDEQTTVTQKTRRVGEFDERLARDAIQVCNPNTIILTFFDYLYPDIKKTGFTPDAVHDLEHYESWIGRQIDMVGVGIGEFMEVDRRLV